MIAVVEVIKAVDGKMEQLKKALHELVPICRKGEGCMQYELFESLHPNNELLVLMKWKDLKDLKRHEASKPIEDFVKKYHGVLYGEVTQCSEWKPVV